MPLLEDGSGLSCNEDVFVGYSPERINTGDKKHRLPDIWNIMSGPTPETADLVDAVYQTIILAGTHKAASTKIAEMAKVVENTWRDSSIALINEVSLICDRLGIDVLDLLQAACTKWSFLPFRPGLVGIHFIGVSVYYSTHKVQRLGYTPEIILAGRRLNDSVGEMWAAKLVKGLAKRSSVLSSARVLVKGLTFKKTALICVTR